MTIGLSKFVDNQAIPKTIAALAGVPNAAGSGAGASVSTPISFVDQYGNGLLPITGNAGQGYAVTVTPSQACFVSFTNKTATGFDIVLSPTGSGVHAGSRHVRRDRHRLIVMTVRLWPDVLAEVKKIALETGASHSRVVAELCREALAARRGLLPAKRGTQAGPAPQPVERKPEPLPPLPAFVFRQPGETQNVRK